MNRLRQLPPWFWPLSVVLLFIGVVAAAAILAPRGPLDDWRRFDPPTEFFAVELPRQPTETSATEVVYGEVVNVRSYTCDGEKGRSHFVQVAKYPEVLEAQDVDGWLLDLDREVFVRGLGATLEQEARFQFHAYPARELRLRRGDEVIRARLFQRMNAVHRVAVVAPADDPALGEQADHYFATFILPQQPGRDISIQKVPITADHPAAPLLELARLKGGWQLAAVTEDGKERKPDVETALTINGDKYTFQQNGRNAFKGKVNVDPGKQILTLHNDDGTELLSATYRLDGDNLRLEFESGEVSTYRRRK